MRPEATRTEQHASRRIQAVDRAALLLRTVADSSAPPTLNELADACGINRSTAWRLLLTLEDNGLVDRDPTTGRYAVGHEVGRLAMRGGHHSLARRLRPTLARLAEASGMSASLAVATSGDPLAVDQCDPPGRRDPSMIGWRLPLHASASGKVQFALLSEAEREEVLRQPLPRYTGSTIADPGRLREHLATVAANGFAIDRDEWDPGWTAVAAPVLVGGELVAMIGVMATSARFQTGDPEAAVPLVLTAAREASVSLQGTPPANSTARGTEPRP